MGTRESIFARTSARRALALFVCAALLYFAAGGTFLHQHKNGPETVCHVCQSLHMPVLAAAPLDLVWAPETVAWYISLPQHAAPNDSLTLHRASRAPPTA